MSALKRPALVGSLLVRKGAATAARQTAQSVSEATPRTVVALPDAFKTAPGPRMPVATEKRFGRQKVRTPAGAPVVTGTDRAPSKKMRLSLGLDSQMHLRLKLAAVHNGTNMRSLVITAIENHLMALGPEIQGGRCACLQAGVLQETCVNKLAEPDDGTDPT